MLLISFRTPQIDHALSFDETGHSKSLAESMALDLVLGNLISLQGNVRYLYMYLATPINSHAPCVVHYLFEFGSQHQATWLCSEQGRQSIESKPALSSLRALHHSHIYLYLLYSQKMFGRSAFRSHRLPPVPEAFPKTQGKKREENDKEEAESSPKPPLPVVSTPPSPLKSHSEDMIIGSSSGTIGKNTGPKPLDSPAEAAASRRIEAATKVREPTESEDVNQVEKTSSVAAGKNHKVEVVEKSALKNAILPVREKLCVKVGEMLGEDRTEFTIYPMLDIEHSDEAMIIRVKDLVLTVSQPG